MGHMIMCCALSEVAMNKMQIHGFKKWFENTVSLQQLGTQTHLNQTSLSKQLVVLHSVLVFVINLRYV